jgi:hypothetical protein
MAEHTHLLGCEFRSIPNNGDGNPNYRPRCQEIKQNGEPCAKDITWLSCLIDNAPQFCSIHHRMRCKRTVNWDKDMSICANIESDRRGYDKATRFAVDQFTIEDMLGMSGKEEHHHLSRARRRLGKQRLIRQRNEESGSDYSDSDSDSDSDSEDSNSSNGDDMPRPRRAKNRANRVIDVVTNATRRYDSSSSSSDRSDSEEESDLDNFIVSDSDKEEVSQENSIMNPQEISDDSEDELLNLSLEERIRNNKRKRLNVDCIDEATYDDICNKAQENKKQRPTLPTIDIHCARCDTKRREYGKYCYECGTKF